MPTWAAESIFLAFFLPLYPEDARKDLARARREDANPARNPTIVGHLDDAARVFVARAPELFGRDIGLDFSDDSVHRLSKELTAARRDEWAAAGSPGSPENVLFNVVVHGAAYVGACVVKNHGGAWSIRRPLWESVVHLASRAGEADLAIFYWWLKSFADDAPTSLADRYRAHVEIPCTRASELPKVFPVDRRLPRIAKDVRYDVLFKYLRAHLPELRDLGTDFPSPERFSDYGFKGVDFTVLGDGRMLLLHGQNADGAHLFWIGAGGFEKAAYYPCDAFPEHRVKLVDDKLLVIVSVSGKVVTHEMLWWGP